MWLPTTRAWLNPKKGYFQTQNKLYCFLNEFGINRNFNCLNTIVYSNNCLLLTPTTNPRLWKTLSLWMWVQSSWLCSITVFSPVFSCSYSISSLWPRNCTASSPPLRRPTSKPFDLFLLGSSNSYTSNPWVNLWVNSRGPRMSRVGG